MYDNKMIKQVCILISAATAVTSAMLTFTFMYNLGSDGFLAKLMGAIGLIMDGTKVIAPFLVFYFWRSKRYISSAFSAIITVALCAVSFTASISAIESKVEDVKVVSQKAVENNNQHAILMNQVESYQRLAEEQRSIGHLTKSRETMRDVEVTLAKAAALNDELTQTASTRTVIKFGKEITIACALLIECVSILMAMALHNSIQNSPIVDQSSINEIDESESVVSSGSALAAEPISKAVKAPEVASSIENTSSVKPLSDEEVAQQIKAAIMDEANPCPPSIRGLASLRLPRETINNALKDLLDEGILEHYRRGYRLVETAA